MRQELFSKEQERMAHQGIPHLVDRLARRAAHQAVQLLDLREHALEVLAGTKTHVDGLHGVPQLLGQREELFCIRQIHKSPSPAPADINVYPIHTTKNLPRQSPPNKKSPAHTKDFLIDFWIFSFLAFLTTLHHPHTSTHATHWHLWFFL